MEFLQGLVVLMRDMAQVLLVQVVELLSDLWVDADARGLVLSGLAQGVHFLLHLGVDAHPRGFARRLVCQSLHLRHDSWVQGSRGASSILVRFLQDRFVVVEEHVRVVQVWVLRSESS